MQQNAPNSYIVSFMPGARGRLIANILYKLANKESTPIVFTEHNSAHTQIDDWYMQYVSDMNQIYSSDHKKPVFFTHMYPNWDTTNTVFINVPSDKLEEVCLNAVIKNVISKIEFLQSGGSFDDTQKNFMKPYEQFLPNNYVEILSNEGKLKDFLHSIQTSFVPKMKSYYKDFIDNTSLLDVFCIDYDKMFDKENGKYVVLKQLTEWIKVEYTTDIHNIFEQYDLDKYKIFEKYCPWLKGENKW
jgi:hypothetical protein